MFFHWYAIKIFFFSFFCTSVFFCDWVSNTCSNKKTLNIKNKFFLNSLVSKNGNKFVLGTGCCMGTSESPLWPVEQISWPGLEVGWPYNFYPNQNTFFSSYYRECWIYITSKLNNKLQWTHYQSSIPSIHWPNLLYLYSINSFHLSII